jgi:hypothetical protein
LRDKFIAKGQQMNQNNLNFEIACVWDTIRDWWQTILVAIIAAIFCCVIFLDTLWNPTVANFDSHCKFTNWILSNSKWSAGSAIINCLLDDGRLIVLVQPAGWQPPEIGSEMKIGVLKKRFYGESFYLK